MIKVLKNCFEIQEANDFFRRNGLPKHGESVEKNWDLFWLCSLVKGMPKEVEIIDLGCGNLYALKLLHALGFENLWGIDLSMPLGNRLIQAYMIRSLKVPFHLHKGDLTHTHFSSRMFDMAVCISVIEHGVNLEKFFIEAGRLLKPGGILFITTDYWEDKIHIKQIDRPFNLAWNIFCRKEIEYIIGLAAKQGFFSYKEENPVIPVCQDKCISWNSQEYTFLAMVFKKQERDIK
jgi:SAM-dependent methyltransferase